MHKLSDVPLNVRTTREIAEAFRSIAKANRTTHSALLAELIKIATATTPAMIETQKNRPATGQ